MLLVGHVSKIVSILLSKLSDCPNNDTSLCYCKYSFLTVLLLAPQVCTNGIISFGRAATQYSPQPLREDRDDNFLIAPFWADGDARLEGQVSYEVHAGSDDLVQKVSTFISTRKGKNFVGTRMLLAEWKGIHPHPHGDGTDDSETMKVNDLAPRPSNFIQHASLNLRAE